MAEIKEIMAVPLQIISPKHNSPVMGIVQDSLLGIFLFTHRDTFIEKDVLMNLMMWIEYTGEIPTPAILKPKPLWTGKQVLSLVIPRVNFSRKGTDWDCRKDSNVLIKDGQLLCGVMNKSVVGSAGGGLVHIVWRDQGPYACRDFMSHLQNIVNQWLQYNGFTVGV
jgi:DNA-directed RNA polymerase II subunit RPB1